MYQKGFTTIIMIIIGIVIALALIGYYTTPKVDTNSSFLESTS
ncbi:MAG: hypothetical protein NTX85_03510 [Candidatus Nomurabacteria bacterium]|nr:hypothetical protein [Candidatus Nomurabacteria bacterium]